MAAHPLLSVTWSGPDPPDAAPASPLPARPGTALPTTPVRKQVERQVVLDPRTLNLAFRNLLAVPEDRIDYSTTSKLRHLYLNSNNLTNLPESLGRLSSLWQLFIFDNALTSLPESIGKLRSLHEFDCSNNLLTRMPTTVGGLRSLVRLNCGRNRFSFTEDVSWVDALRALPELRLPTRPTTDGVPPPLPPRSVTAKGVVAVRKFFATRELAEHDAAAKALTPFPKLEGLRSTPQSIQAEAERAERSARAKLANERRAEAQRRAAADALLVPPPPPPPAEVRARLVPAPPTASSRPTLPPTNPPTNGRLTNPPGSGRPTNPAGDALLIQPTDLRIGRAIDEGAFAEVFRAMLWGQRVAVKRLMVERAGADVREELRRELLHETRLLAMLSHPCIVQCIGYTTEPAQLVLEVLDGTSYDLALSFYNDSKPTSALLDPLVDLLAGCAYLHARSPPLLHRDLKPPNMLHDARGRSKLCDFGTCLELEPNAPLPTEWVGSQLYVAPEVDKEAPYGLPADVFSFGVLAYELYHLMGTGISYYGEGDMFEGGGLLDGIETIRTPLLEANALPERPGACDVDAVWELLGECLNVNPSKRPSFAQVATRMSEAQTAAAGANAWL